MTDLDTLARLVRQRREELGLSQKSAAASVGMSAMTWNRVEVQAEPVKPLSYSGVERALGWVSGSIREYLDGGALPDVVPPTRADSGPGLYVASDDELLNEVGRRLKQRRGPGVEPREAPEGTESAESVTARGMVPGRVLTQQPEDVNRAGGQA